MKPLLVGQAPRACRYAGYFTDGQNKALQNNGEFILRELIRDIKSVQKLKMQEYAIPYE